MPTAYEMEYAEARNLMKQRKWAEAAIVLRSTLKKRPSYLPAEAELARALAYVGRREEALGIMEQAIQGARAPDRPVLIRKLDVLARFFLTNATFQSYQDGLDLFLVKKFRPARERFEKALEHEPDNVEILVRVGQCLTLDGDFDSAAERLKLARKLNPYDPEVHLWLGRAMHKRGEVMQAIEELRAAETQLPASELAPVWLAEAVYSTGQKASAIQVLEDDVKSRPLHVQALLTLAHFQSLIHDPQALWSARKNLQLALSRLDRYASADPTELDGESGLDLREPAPELKDDIQKLMHDVEGKLEDFSS